MIRLPLLVLLAVSFAALPAAAQQAPADVPVTRVVVFSSGVAYFEHAGQVTGDAAVKLNFKTDQINDVLKSMVVMDTSGKGAVTGVTYASREPLSRALSSFAVNLSGNPDIGQMLMQVRGTDVVVEAPEKITGKVLGLETKKRAVSTAGETTILEETYLNLVAADGGIRSIPLSTLQSVHLSDARLRKELDKALKLLIDSADTQRRPVEIQFRGEGKRAVRIGYIAEAPVWKVSYRLELSGDKPYLQGWAIVENTSDADWTGVGLSLISGRPISFIQDLYTPLYVPRPIVQPENYASLRPKEYEEGNVLEDEVAEMANESRSGKRKLARQNRSGLKSNFAAGAPEPAAAYARKSGGGVALGRNVQPGAAGEKVGELFQFTLKEPVDLPRRQSAMLPIIAQAIAAEKVSIYNQQTLAKHPLNGAWLKNDTGMKMLAGPVTVFDGKMYAGDARIGNLAENDRRLISYAVDLNMTVDPSNRAVQRLTAATIDRGVLRLKYLIRHEQSYKITNKADEHRTVVLEHPRRQELKLIEPKQITEETPTLYRFQFDVAAGKTVAFPVIQEQVTYNSVSLLGQSPESLLHYAKTGELSADAKKALQQAAEMKRHLTEAQKKLAELSKTKSQIESGQDRLRRNIATVGANSTLGKRYIQKLSQQEDQIEQLNVQIEGIQKQIEAMSKQLAEFIAGMKF
jgi:hypothetical protein